MEGLFTIAVVFTLGISAQWLAWRYRTPSILLLLVFGFLAGPVTGIIDPQTLRGTWLFPFVSIAVGIILFEGGLSLRVSDLRDVGRVVGRLISLGVLITWALAAVAAFFLLDFPIGLALTLGALLTVTGPTVIIPLLRHVRPTGRVGTIAKWEGITIDPVGAILAVLVLESVMLLHEPGAADLTFGETIGHALRGLLLEAVIGLGVGVAGAAGLILFLRRRLVPDYLQNSIVLMGVIAIFALSDNLQEESGLLATTVMGLIMANQRFVSVQRIIEFKEDLRVLLISVLFIVLSARLELSNLAYLNWIGSLLFLATLIFVVRPVSVFGSLMGTDLARNEKLFLAWLAPRGIVAAAVASLFSFRLTEAFPTEAPMLAPIVLLVIAGTVAVYGLSLGRLAGRLGLAYPNPQGVLFVGAHEWAREMAKALREHNIDVLLVDTNRANVEEAQSLDLPAQRANVLSEGVMDELELSTIGRMLALTPNDEVNTLATLHFAEMFDSAEVYQLAARTPRREASQDELPPHLRGRPLFGPDTTFRAMTDAVEQGAAVQPFPGDLTAYDSLKEIDNAYGGALVPLFLIRGEQLFVYAQADTVTPAAGDELIVLAHPDAKPQEERDDLDDEDYDEAGLDAQP